MGLLRALNTNSMVFVWGSKFLKHGEYFPANQATIQSTWWQGFVYCDAHYPALPDVAKPVLQTFLF